MTSPPPSTDGTEETESAGAEPVKPESGEPIKESMAEEHVKSEPVEEKSEDSLEILAHPEDKPAPLFAKKTETTESTPAPAPEPQASVESLDTTMGEAGDSLNSILMGNTEEHPQPSEEAPAGHVVGDFLKMQFVEHKVVPTILVSPLPRLVDILLIFPGFLLPLPME